MWFPQDFEFSGNLDTCKPYSYLSGAACVVGCTLDRGVISGPNLCFKCGQCRVKFGVCATQTPPKSDRQIYRQREKKESSCNMLIRTRDNLWNRLTSEINICTWILISRQVSGSPLVSTLFWNSDLTSRNKETQKPLQDLVDLLKCGDRVSQI